MAPSSAHPLSGPTVTCWGAARNVTGSMHLLEAGGRKVLLECGMFRGPREEARHRNRHFPFHPQQLDAVLLSHAHVDHCGNLPTLVRQGFAGPIFCTPATRDLLAVMLADSAKIQEEDAAHLNIARGYAEPWTQPLYTRSDADRVLDQVVALPLDTPRVVAPGIEARLVEAGHILGSAMVAVTVAGPDCRTHSLTFTGDLGRIGLPCHRPPAPVPPADVLLCECTYGGRMHEPIAVTVAKLEAAVIRTVARGGKVLIPAFSLGRTQLVVHYLLQAIHAGRIPALPVFVDSPLAADIAEVYGRYPGAWSVETASSRSTLHAPRSTIPDGEAVHYVRNFEESTRLSTRPGPCLIVAASGMCDAGRILHHLKHNIDDPRNTVVLVSFQAPGTLGRRLLEPRPTVRFLGKDWNKWTDVVHLDGFSGHADRSDFEALLGPLVGRVRRVRLIHGEPEQAEALAATLRDLGFADVGIPETGESVPLD